MPSTLPTMAVVGLGAMGTRLALNLIAAGYPVIVTNRSPDLVRRLATEVVARGPRFLEAPVMGSRPQVDAHALIHLVGDPEDELADARDILAVSAAQIHHIGGYGAAATLKLIINALLATQVAAVAGLLATARRAGLDLDRSMTVLTGLPVASPTTTRAIGVMRAEDFSPNFPVRLVAKDLTYLTTLAAQLGVEAPRRPGVIRRSERVACA